MIENEIQFQVTKDSISKFRSVLEIIRFVDNMDKIIKETQTEALRSIIQELEEELTIYERAKTESRNSGFAKLQKYSSD